MLQRHGGSGFLQSLSLLYSGTYNPMYEVYKCNYFLFLTIDSINYCIHIISDAVVLDDLCLIILLYLFLMFSILNCRGGFFNEKIRDGLRVISLQTNYANNDN